MSAQVNLLWVFSQTSLGNTTISMGFNCWHWQKICLLLLADPRQRFFFVKRRLEKIIDNVVKNHKQ